MASNPAQQWLIDPANPATPMYMTNKEEVARKRAEKGDYVVLLERAGSGAARPDFVPYYRRLLPPAAPTTEEDEEL